MFIEHTYNTGVVTINYAEVGVSGQPLVLLHGGSARWQSSLPIIPELSQQWHLFAPDLRGHGKSGRVSGRYQLKDYVGISRHFWNTSSRNLLCCLVTH